MASVKPSKLQKFDATTSSDQNSILNKGVSKFTDKNESRFLELPTQEVDIEK